MSNGRDLPRLIILSRVLPLPRQSGQQQRVYYTLQALRERFHVTFLSVARAHRAASIRARLEPLCDQVLLLPSRYARSWWHKCWHRLVGALFCLRTGLRFSNYLSNRVELAPQRVAGALGAQEFDVALYEYWHAVDSLAVFQARGVPCVLDMHDILWQAYARQLQGWPSWWRQRNVRHYRVREQAAWARFDALVAINSEERDEVRRAVPDRIPVWHTPMGIEIDQWPACWEPSHPPRIAYYGGLGNPHRRRDALRCYRNIMPSIWRQIPEAQLWLVGSGAPRSLFALSARDHRVRVTGFVEKVQEVLKSMTVLLCPWQGTYGFRSRLIEAMALGLPVVASDQAAYGMDLEAGQGILLEPDDRRLAGACLELLSNPALAREQSRRARRQVLEKFSFEATYGRWSQELARFVAARRAHRGSLSCAS